MAENNTTASRDLVCEGSITQMSNFRCCVAIDAAGEINQLCRVLRQTARQDDDYGLAVRGISARISELSRAVLDVVSDENKTGEELACIVRLEEEEA